MREFIASRWFFAIVWAILVIALTIPSVRIWRETWRRVHAPRSECETDAKQKLG